VNQALDFMTDAGFGQLTQVFLGVNYGNFRSVKDLVHKAKLVTLSEGQQSKAVSMASRDRGGGAVACAMGHLALWQKAAEFSGP